MKHRLSDQDVDQLLRMHAQSLGEPRLTDEQRTDMIAALLKADQEALPSATPADPVPPAADTWLDVLRARIRRRPLAAALALTAVVVLVGVGITRLSNQPQSGTETATQAPPVPASAPPTGEAAPAPSVEPGQPAQAAVEHRPVTIAAIQAVFMLRDEGATATADSVARSTVFNALRQRLRPLGIACTARGDELSTSLDVLPAGGGAPRRLHFRYDREAGEVLADPAGFTIATAAIADEALTAAVHRAAEDSYNALNRH